MSVKISLSTSESGAGRLENPEDFLYSSVGVFARKQGLKHGITV